MTQYLHNRCWRAAGWDRSASCKGRTAPYSRCSRTVPTKPRYSTTSLGNAINLRKTYRCSYARYRYPPVLRVRIHRIRMFLGLLDPDPLVRGTDPAQDPAPDPSIIAKIARKTLSLLTSFLLFWLFCWCLEGQWQKQHDPDPFVGGMDPPIRIRTTGGTHLWIWFSNITGTLRLYDWLCFSTLWSGIWWSEYLALSL